jgi:hypothetical protein
MTRRFRFLRNHSHSTLLRRCRFLRDHLHSTLLRRCRFLRDHLHSTLLRRCRLLRDHFQSSTRHSRRFRLLRDHLTTKSSKLGLPGSADRQRAPSCSTSQQPPTQRRMPLPRSKQLGAATSTCNKCDLRPSSGSPHVHGRASVPDYPPHRHAPSPSPLSLPKPAAAPQKRRLLQTGTSLSNMTTRQQSRLI